MRATLKSIDQGVEGFSRREFLAVGGVSLGGAMLHSTLLAGSADRPVRRPVIHIHLPGGPSHLDLFDLKPGAPAEVRGEFRPIATNVSGVSICELLPQLARLADRYSIIRSLTDLRDEHSSRSSALNHDELACEPGGGTVPQFVDLNGIGLNGIGAGESDRECARSPAVARALRSEQVPLRTRARYGIDVHPANARFLQARRLIDAGVGCVHLSWGRWDTHGENFRQLRRQLPALDVGLAGLIRDLEGRLQDVTITMSGEFGRTPRINGGAGRDHWPRAAFFFIAGGGFRHGQTIGATDALGGEPVDRPLRLQEIVGTIYRPRAGRLAAGASGRSGVARETCIPELV